MNYQSSYPRRREDLLCGDLDGKERNAFPKKQQQKDESCQQVEYLSEGGITG